jgi:hypothetical protein
VEDADFFSGLDGSDAPPLLPGLVILVCAFRFSFVRRARFRGLPASLWIDLSGVPFRDWGLWVCGRGGHSLMHQHSASQEEHSQLNKPWSSALEGGCCDTSRGVVCTGVFKAVPTGCEAWGTVPASEDTETERFLACIRGLLRNSIEHQLLCLHHM